MKKIMTLALLAGLVSFATVASAGDLSVGDSQSGSTVHHTHHHHHHHHHKGTSKKAAAPAPEAAPAK